jgi:membrane protease YdiL (CAAX protease family)
MVGVKVWTWLRLLAGVVLFYALALLLAGVMTPVAYAGFAEVFGGPFARYFDRMRYVALLILWPLVAWWIAYKSWRDFGWGRVGAALAIFGVAVASTFGVVAYVLVGVGDLVWPPWGQMVWLMGVGVASGVGVALIEEPLFRGILQRGATLRLGVAGVAVAALAFALLHGRPEVAVAAPYDLADGLAVAWAHLTQPGRGLTPLMLTNICLLGAALGLLYYRSGSLWVAIAMHAGVVAVASPATAILRMNMEGVRFTYLLDIWPTTLLLALWCIGAAFYRWPAEKRKDATPEVLPRA